MHATFHQNKIMLVPADRFKVVKFASNSVILSRAKRVTFDSACLDRISHNLETLLGSYSQKIIVQ